MAKRKLPQPGTKEYDKLVSLAALEICQEPCVLLLAVNDFLSENRWHIGGEAYKKPPAQRLENFLFDVVGYLIEKPLTGTPEEDVRSADKS
jgi:hypothetical protein